MSVDLALLRTEITAGPKAAILAPLYAAGNDTGVAAELNKLDIRGVVPIVEMARYCSEGITGGVQALLSIPIGTDIAPGTPMTLKIAGALHTVMNIMYKHTRLEECDVDNPAFSAVVDFVLVPFGIMTAADKVALLALGNNRQSRAMIAVGQPVSASDVGNARAL